MPFVAERSVVCSCSGKRLHRRRAGCCLLSILQGQRQGYRFRLCLGLRYSFRFRCRSLFVFVTIPPPFSLFLPHSFVNSLKITKFVPAKLCVHVRTPFRPRETAFQAPRSPHSIGPGHEGFCPPPLLSHLFPQCVRPRARIKNSYPSPTALYFRRTFYVLND